MRHLRLTLIHFNRERRIDFILVSGNIIVDECHASHILDLGSDHRVVLAKMHLPKQQTKPKVKRGWRPNASYINELNAKLDDNQDVTLETLNMLLVHCTLKYKIPDSTPSCCKPWQDVEVRRLIADRKGCRNCVRRLELSKLILKQSVVLNADIVPQKPSEYFRSSVI